MSLPGLTLFMEQIGSTFDAIDAQPTPFELTMTRLVEHSKTEHSEAFSIFFSGPVDCFMPQGTRKLRHEQLGEMDVFLVPVAKINEGFEYEAAFNYLLK